MTKTEEELELEFQAKFQEMEKQLQQQKQHFEHQLQQQQQHVQRNIGSTPPQQEIFRVSAKIPPFYQQKPDLWFIQVESQFRSAGITQDATKFDTVVGVLEPRYLDSIADILRNPPATGKYEALKLQLIKEFTDSETKRIRQLLQELRLDDLTPTRLLKKMRELACGSMGENVLQNLFLERLPSQIQQIVANAPTLDKMSQDAYKILEISNMNSVSEASNEIAALRKEIAELKLGLNESNRGRNRDRSSSKHRNRSNSKKFETCWYHYKFKGQAKKCTPPCNFNKTSEN